MKGKIVRVDLLSQVIQILYVNASGLDELLNSFLLSPERGGFAK